MMKQLYRWIQGIAILITLILNACNNEEASLSNITDNSSTCILTAKDFRWDNESSRSALTVENGAAKFSWTPGDRVGILPDTGAQVYFEIPQSTNNNELTDEERRKASFDGGAWALKASSNYAAYYPFIKDFDLNRTKVPVDYTGQKQIGASTNHLGAYDYLAARPVTTNPNGGVTFDFDHVGALILIKFIVPNAGTALKNVTLSADGVAFTTKGTYNLTSTKEKGFPITSTETSDCFTMEVDYTTITDNEEITIYFMTAPIDLSGKKVNVSVAYGEESDVLKLAADGKNFMGGEGYLLEAGDPTPYLTFHAVDKQTMTLLPKGNFVNVVNLQYSVNGNEWANLTTEAIEFGGTNGNLRLRGQRSTGTANNTNDFYQISFENKNVEVSCSGDIRTLVDYTNHTKLNGSGVKFCNLFKDCTVLTTAPTLPFIYLEDYCYSSMFEGCTGLTSAPELPATEMMDWCYSSMFKGCTSLTTAPALPATTLHNGGYCYDSMFYGCTGLTSAPKLPATTLSAQCYGFMFQGCTGLTSAPELPATTLSSYCYYNMFDGCTSLTTAPELPATKLAGSCYSAMFEGCTGLTSAPELPATTMANQCYDHMFGGCTGLTSAPVLPGMTLAEWCYSYMFSRCTGLTSAPELPATTLADYCYAQMFNGCTGLTSSPVLPAETLVKGCYYYMFQKCSNLNSVTMLATNISATSCLNNWLIDVSSNGVITKAVNMTSLPSGTSGIPEGWTTLDYTK